MIEEYEDGTMRVNSGPVFKSLRLDISAMGHQLHAARYAFHKVRCKMYGDAVHRGEMGVDEACERYTLAMRNYDELIRTSASGSVTDADQADMDKGFAL